MAEEAGEWVPGQYNPLPKIYDLRFTMTGPKGYKLRNQKRARDDDGEDDEHMQEGEPMVEGTNLDRRPKRLRSDVQRDVSGLGGGNKRSWKEPKERVNKVVKPTSWEKKMKQKSQTKVYREHKEAAMQDFKDKRKAMSDKRKEAAKRKEEKRKKAEVVQVITNPATLKKMMKNKKMAKKLVSRDTN